MKKFITLFAAVAVLFAFASCSNGNSDFGSGSSSSWDGNGTYYFHGDDDEEECGKYKNYRHTYTQNTLAGPRAAATEIWHRYEAGTSATNFPSGEIGIKGNLPGCNSEFRFNELLGPDGSTQEYSFNSWGRTYKFRITNNINSNNTLEVVYLP